MIMPDIVLHIVRIDRERTQDQTEATKLVRGRVGPEKKFWTF